MPVDPVRALRFAGRADPSCLEEVHHLLDELWLQAPGVALTDRYAFETALIEVAGNIVRHGGPDVRMGVRLVAHEDCVEALLCDTGRTVALPEAEDPPVDPLAEHGRGIALARAAADVVAYQRDGTTNRWQVVKYTSPAV